MDKPEHIHDPLTYGDPIEDPDSPMEDLTQHLENSQLLGHISYPDPVKTHAAEPLPSAAHKLVNPLESPKDSPKSPEAFTSYGQLVNPPSYEDSMLFRPSEAPSTSTSDQQQQQQQDPAPPSELAPSLSLPSTPAPEQALQIVVSEPVKREQQGVFGLKGGYVVYKVSTRSSLTHFRAAEFSVRRRFREVVELAAILRERFRGYFIPPRPDKNAVEGQRMKEGFVEERRVALERYLQHLARHPIICRSEELRLFLEVEGELAQCGAWAALLPSGAGLIEGTAKLGRQLTGREGVVADPQEASKPTKAGNIFRAVKESVQNLKSTPSIDPEEAALRRQRESLEALREALLATSRSAEGVVAKDDKVGAVLGDLALALLHLSKFEESNGGPLAKYTGTLRYCGALVADCKKAAAALLKLSKVSRGVAGRAALTLEPLHEFLSFMPSAVRAFASREHQLLTQQTLEADLEARRRSVAELEAGGGARTLGGAAAKTRKAADLRAEIARLEAAIVAAKQEYDKIKAANTSELERFQEEQRVAFTGMLRSLAVLQVAASQRNTEIWTQAAQELGASREEVASITGAAVASGSGSHNHH